jgi:hypothetical protein
MMLIYKFFTCSLFFLLALAALPSISSASNNTITELQEKALEQQLWRHQEWINLLHYDVNDKTKDEYLSQVDDKRFFNAENGKTNSKDELLATISAFYRIDLKDNEHPQCRFVARLEWLQKKLSINTETLPVQNCEEYNEWIDIVKSDKVTMIFPAYNLNSPSSMFGHTLLRLDKKFGENESEWLSYAVNFGANLNEDDENSLFYAFKGLSGGYPGNFVVAPYFKKINEYNRIESRDIWEYRLDLTAEETHRMINHLWELKEMNFDYFFLDENCSYRLLELLEVARPGIELTDEFVLTAIPVDTVRAIERTNMIEAIEYRPSQVTKLQHMVNQMPEDDLDLVEIISSDLSFTENESFTSLSEDRKRDILNASYEYLRYLEKDKARDAVTAKHSYKLLSLINSYPASDHIPTPPRPTPPELSHGSKKFSVAIGERLDESYLDIGYRMSFHDLEDNEHGFLRGAQINLGSINFRTDSDATTRLSRLDFVDIFSATPRSRFFTPITWRVYTGFERQLTGLDDVLVSHVTGGAGVSYIPWRNGEFYGLGTLRLEHNENMNSTIEPGIGLITGLLHHFNGSTARIELNGEQFDDDIYRVKSSYKHNFVISTNHSLKLMAVREWHSSINFSEFSLSYQYYF